MEMILSPDEWLIWQLVDSAFPAGSLAHSNGLEAAVDHGLVHDSATVEAFIEAGLTQCRRGSLAFVRAARREPESFISIDHDCDLFLNNHVTNRASRAQGRSFFAAASRIFLTPQATSSTLTSLGATIRDSQSPNHYAPMFGVVLGLLKISEPQTMSLFSFIFVRACISSSVRLGVVGPLEGQRIQSRLRDTVADFDSPPIQTAPVLDLLQGTQDRIYSRLFQS